MFWLIGTAFAQLPYSDDVAGFHQSFSRNRVFGGVWALREMRGPNLQIKIEPKTSKFFLFFVAVSKMSSRQKQSVFFRLRPLAPPIWAVRTENT